MTLKRRGSEAPHRKAGKRIAISSSKVQKFWNSRAGQAEESNGFHPCQGGNFFQMETSLPGRRGRGGVS